MISSSILYRLCSFGAAALLVAAAIPFGCSDSANSAGNGPFMPNVGSSYTMSVTQSVLGAASPTKKELDVTLRVADMIFEGKEHVGQFSADTMISLVAYEPNGDLSVYLRREQIGSCIVEAQWLRFPFRGVDSVSDVLKCVPVSAPGRKSGTAVARWSARSSGTERISVQGREIDVLKVEAGLTIYADSAAVSVPLQSRLYEIWYAPDLGYTVRERLVSLVHRNGSISGETGGVADGEIADTLGTSYRELTGYVLK